MAFCRRSKLLLTVIHCWSTTQSRSHLAALLGPAAGADLSDRLCGRDPLPRHLQFALPGVGLGG